MLRGSTLAGGGAVSGTVTATTLATSPPSSLTFGPLGGAGVGGDGTNVALRGYASGGIYFQNAGGITIYASMTSAAFSCQVPLLFGPDNTQDIGAAGATRPRNIWAAGIISTAAIAVASLPAAATAGAGARSFVNNSTVTLTAGIGAVVAGGGSNGVPVVSDGTSWRIG